MREPAVTETDSSGPGRRAGAGVGLLFLVLAAPLILIGAVFYALSGALLYLAVWFAWCLRGRYVLLVYSDSPIWRDYFDNEIIPVLEKRAVILNWSQRKRWRHSLAVLAFRRFGGRREFNPLAVVFRPFRLAEEFRFYRPFKELKHGKPEKVEALKCELLKAVEAASGERTG